MVQRMSIGFRVSKRTETELIAAYVTPRLREAFPLIYLTKIVGTSFNKGVPDLSGTLDKYGFMVECKKEDNDRGRPTALQLTHLNNCARAGGASFCLVFTRPYRGTYYITNFTLDPANHPIYNRLIAALGHPETKPAASM